MRSTSIPWGMTMTLSKTRNGLYRTTRAVSREELLSLAKSLIAEELSRGDVMSSPEATRRFLAIELAEEEREVFAVVFLDSQHRLMAFERMFLGTIDSATVHPREVVKRCLALNAAAVIVAHNHPSGVAEPSAADRQITERLKSALALIDVRLLDHFVVGGADCVSFAERGWA